MTYKQSGFSQFTKKQDNFGSEGWNYDHPIIKKAQKAFQNRKWAKGVERSGGQLDNWVAERSKHKKGSSEYNAIQNKINKALGSGKRH